MSIGRLSLDVSSHAHTESELVTRAARGEAEAFGDLYERHLDAIYRYVYARVGDGAEAEDITENVFLRAWEALGRYPSEDLRFRALLFKIAHNLIIDRYRTQKHEHDIDGLEEYASADHVEPEQGLIASERSARLAAALARLDPLQQQVVTLRFISGLSHAEAADVIGKSDGAVRVLQHRALAALRALLGRDD